MSSPEPKYRSKIAIFDLESRQSRVVFEAEGVYEAPNWARDGSYLLINGKGDLFKLAPEGGPLAQLPLGGGGYLCNNDHDLSPDGLRLAFSAATPQSERSQVFVSGADGRQVRLVTPAAPSYFHGWSPDGEWLAYVAERGDGNFELYRVSSQGGQEQRLTCAGGYDDGCEYSPNGRWIYFNSNRTGCWHLWRIPADGAGPDDALAQQLTHDGPEDWFPHVSPDGQYLVWISFPQGTEGHSDKMPGMQLRMCRTPGDNGRAEDIEVLEEFYGGQGTLNVNSWSPDSRQFAYVIYELLD